MKKKGKFFRNFRKLLIETNVFNIKIIWLSLSEQIDCYLEL